MPRILTPEQKELNGEVARLRDLAFRRRKNAYKKALEAEQLPIADFTQAVQNADKALEDAYAARDEAVAGIELRIQQLGTAKQEYKTQIKVLTTATETARSNLQEAKSNIKSAVADRFGDVAYCSSASSWQPIPSVQDAHSLGKKDGKITEKERLMFEAWLCGKRAGDFIGSRYYGRLSRGQKWDGYRYVNKEGYSECILNTALDAWCDSASLYGAPTISPDVFAETAAELIQLRAELEQAKQRADSAELALANELATHTK